MTKESRYFKRGIGGKKPNFMDHWADPEAADAQQRGWEQHQANRDMADQIARQQHEANRDLEETNRDLADQIANEREQQRVWDQQVRDLDDRLVDARRNGRNDNTYLIYDSHGVLVAPEAHVDPAEQIADARRDDNNSTKSTPRSYRSPAYSDAKIKKLFFYCLSFVSLAAAVFMFSVSTAFSLVWWVGVVAVIFGMPAILILFGLIISAGIAALALLVVLLILSIIIAFVKHLIANPV